MTTARALRFYPRLAERGEVLARVPVKQELIVDQLVGRVGIRLLFGKAVLGQGMRKEAGAKYLVVQTREDFFLAVDRHSRSSTKRSVRECLSDFRDQSTFVD